MTDTRAPDPTLTVLMNSGESGCRLLWLDGLPYEGVSIAHKHHPQPKRWNRSACGAFAPVLSDPYVARWFAVPCRDCFPDAPPLGHRYERIPERYGESVRTVPNPDLAWQVVGQEGQ